MLTSYVDLAFGKIPFGCRVMLLFMPNLPRDWALFLVEGLLFLKELELVTDRRSTSVILEGSTMGLGLRRFSIRLCHCDGRPTKQPRLPSNEQAITQAASSFSTSALGPQQQQQHSVPQHIGAATSYNHGLLSLQGTGTRWILWTTDVLGHFFEEAFGPQFLKAELGGATEQQLFTVHALLLQFPRFGILLLLMVLL
ncbi:hypothetical protein EYF80_002359 [Liparis tanakae]|uniref:Uncharacterized protein n=1 Tax=Liparis tanakae TaxID=230148 RepID=A0A4Z2JAX4_9TELE|nr:hypothetical protein EYF80_002359 [Liparis tanakae]